MRLKIILSLAIIIFIGNPSILNANGNPNNWSARFEKFLADIRENSLQFANWIVDNDEEAKKKFEDVVRQFSFISNEERFQHAVAVSLSALGDNHSYLIPNSDSYKEYSESPLAISIEAVDGIGIITVPGVPITVSNDTKDNVLANREVWVKEFQEKISEVSPSVSKGWILDLTKNDGGSFYPMIAALSGFFKQSDMGGFFIAANGKLIKQEITFDGKVFCFDHHECINIRESYPLNTISLPTVAIINQNTASSGEFLALALKRQPNIVVIGQPTFGIASVNAVMSLPENLGYYMLTIGYFMDVNNEPLLQKKIEPTILIEGDNIALLEHAKAIIKNYQG